jgi:two-component system, chemotaxis family, chemotaxis protein CheY
MARTPMTKRRVLLVDDDPGICRTVNIALTNAGYEVIEARDGEEASRLWRDSGADLVIADIYMPWKSGLQLIMELHAQSPSTPFIAMTDGGQSKNFNPLTYSEVLGAVRTIAKPFSLDQMVAMVGEVLNRPSK